ncbi:MAG: Metallo-beta-lactamase L1 type 3 [Luteibacter sp.]|uniref:subclass B3 metallo-beta-lactamase n=1 Tax=Luteibacter sp. TaxID=1886636 RepID=UPI00137DAD5F|nr:subclass B3 metallo-beta-lactamase [Luteibacter sp.]KAF1006146.1 MAG: Metallo-beta-lactamase L1 type 3 [Luteibacter sp.]
MRRLLLALAACAALPALADDHPEWTQPVAPHAIFANTYYVGTKGLSSILVTSPQGHVLIDVPMNDAIAAQVEANIRTLGFKPEDIRLILNSHPHFDHAGGIAKLAKDTGAPVRTTAATAKAMLLGGRDPDDPQFGEAAAYTALKARGDIVDGTVVSVGPLRLTAHITPGHTPGGTAWTWRSCEGASCKDIAFVDSLFAFSSDSYRYSAHPAFVSAYRKTFERVAALPCDLLITPHPEQGEGETCKSYAAAGAKRLDEKLASEKKAH